MDASEKGVGPEGSAPAGFEIEGERYEVPSIFSLNLDEERILYLYADAVVWDFIPPHPKASDEEKQEYFLTQARKLRNPDLKRAVAFIAYRRRHPEVDDGDILKSLGKLNALELNLAMLGGDEDPPDQSSRNEQNEQMQTSGPMSGTDSESNGNSHSAEVVDLPVRTGTPESDTSSPGAPPTGLAS